MGEPWVSPEPATRVFLGIRVHPRRVLGSGYADFFPPHPDEAEPPLVLEKKPLPWEQDMALHSRFLERKVRRAAAGLGSPCPSPASHPLPA